MLYRTYFKLTNSVNDFEEAKKYLVQHDMTKYMSNDKRISNETFLKIKHIEWILKDISSGYIDLETVQELSLKELNGISDWVKGQCSDGLGEGFEQQSFACYEDKGLEGYNGEDWDDECIMASFDWQTNDYKFELISK